MTQHHAHHVHTPQITCTEVLWFLPRLTRFTTVCGETTGLVLLNVYPQPSVLIGWILFGNHDGRLDTGESMTVVDRLLTWCNVPIMKKQSLLFVLCVYSSVQMSLLSRYPSISLGDLSRVSRGCLERKRGLPLVSCQPFIWFCLNESKFLRNPEFVSPINFISLILTKPVNCYGRAPCW